MADVPKESADLFKTIRFRIAAALDGFTNDFPDDLNSYAMEPIRPDRAEFPVPELVLLVLRGVMGFQSSGHEEKVRWSVYCQVAGEPVIFQYQKFGFTIFCRPASSLKVERIRGQLHAAIRILERALDTFAQS